MIAQTTQANDAAKPAAGRPLWLPFVLIGLLIYLAAYLASEHLVNVYGQRNRLFTVATLPAGSYDFVILGASHAMPLGFEDMNGRLEAAAHGRVVNLSIEGGGIEPARFILDYFLMKHETKTVVYVVDSFAFYTKQWNEIRLDDAKLMKRAPFDPALPPVLWKYPSMRGLIPGYVSGFYKINDADRLDPDVSDMERNEFHRVYRANAYLDRERFAYLYPGSVDQTEFARYLSQFLALADDLDKRGVKLIVIRPPMPGRVLKMLTGEAEFNARVQEIVAKHNGAFRDFSQVSNDDKFFFDTDHLNRDGVVNFMDSYLVPTLTGGDPPVN